MEWIRNTPHATRASVSSVSGAPNTTSLAGNVSKSFGATLPFILAKNKRRVVQPSGFHTDSWSLQLCPAATSMWKECDASGGQVGTPKAYELKNSGLHLYDKAFFDLDYYVCSYSRLSLLWLNNPHGPVDPEDSYMFGSKTYTVAAGVWPRGPKLVILSVLDTQIARFPLGFLETCGDNTWGYIRYVVSLLVASDSAHPGCLVDTTTGLGVDLDAVPVAGVYRYLEEGKTSEVAFTFGPTGTSSIRPAAGVEAQSISDRSRHSTDQSDFRQALLARDSVCLVSGHPWSDCQASHIVPWSRTDVYQLIDGDADENYNTKAGLLLDSRLHHELDALKWSLYFKNNVFYVHYFNPQDQWRRELNGKTIPPSAFRGSDAPPDPALTAWHYAQTVMARVRGFAAGFGETTLLNPS